MKKLYTAFFIFCMAAASDAQTIVSVSPYTIPSTGSFTLTIVGRNTFFLSHPVSYARLSQPNNSDGSYFTSISETVISDDTVQATFNISNPAHGGYYDLSMLASNIYINTKVDGVYMLGTEPRRIFSVTPNYGVANNIISAQITGAQMHFMSSTGAPQVGSVWLQSEIDNSVISGSNVNYIDTNNITVNFNIPSYATNGKYTLDVDLQQFWQTNRTYFFTVIGGVKKKIISVDPHQGMKGDSALMVVRVTGRNLVTNAVYNATLTSELAGFSIYIPYSKITTIDSNHVLLRAFIPAIAPEGDYSLMLAGTPQLTKHYAFRVVPPDIKGVVFRDLDSNGVQNGSEQGISGRKVILLPDSIIAFTDITGNYFYYADPGNYTIQYMADTSYALTTAPSYNVVVLDSSQSGFDFGLYKMPTFEHQFYASTQNMRCNTTTYTSWWIHNPEDIIHQGTLTLLHSPNMSVTFTSIPPDYVNGDTMVWNYTVNPMQTLSCNVNFLCPAAGQTVWYTYEDHIANHYYHFALTRTVTCSYDPNDKSVQPEETVTSPSTLNTELLTYNINFQNTGNDTAFLVVLVDTISPILDLSTFEIVGSSHSMVTTLDVPNRIVTFTFENILLPDSNVDEPGSHGFATYKIRALQGIPDSSIVTNTGYIYFDFNPAVITNTVTSHLVYYLLPQASFTTADPAVCMLECINYASTSANATSWQWSFPGGIPSSSTDENPQNICYLTTGNFDVQLIATNGFSSDTMNLTNYITVNALPPPPVIYESHDTLYCVIEPQYTGYQWYDTVGLIPGATNSYYVPPFSGLFGLSVYNQEGCESASSMPIVLGIQQPEVNDLHVYPNPAGDRIFISGSLLKQEGDIEVTNLIGEKMLMMKRINQLGIGELEIELRNFSPGIYFVKFQNQDKIIVKRFVKN